MRTLRNCILLLECFASALFALTSGTNDTVRAISPRNPIPRLHVAATRPLNTLIDCSAQRLGMAGIGLTFPTDNLSIGGNPAFLGVPNPAWKGLASGFSFLPLYPATKIRDMGKGEIDFASQPGSEKVGGFGLSISSLFLGTNDISNDQGIVVARTLDAITEICLSWGHSLKVLDFDKQSFGISLKLLTGSGVFDYYHVSNQGFLCDLGYQAKFFDLFSLGLVASNLGAQLKGLEYDIVEMQDSAGRIQEYERRITLNSAYSLSPTRLSGAIGFCRSKDFNGLRVLDVNAEMEARKDFVSGATRASDNLFVCLGGQCVLYRTAQVRMGVDFDKGARQWHYSIGAGLSILNHFELQTFYIALAPDDPYQKGQYGIGFSFNRMFAWSKKDLAWMRSEKGD